MRDISGLSFENIGNVTNMEAEQTEIICYKYLIRASIHPVVGKTDGLVFMKILIKSKIVHRKSMSKYSHVTQHS